MYIVLGATGHVGSSVVNTLVAAGKPVIGVTHSEEGRAKLEGLQVEVAVVDVLDTSALREVFQRGNRAFLLNPPADIAGDTDKGETATARAITEALAGSGLEKIVVESTYGAKPGDAIGDLTVLYDFEQQAIASGIPAAINRGAYYYTNFAMLIDAARKGTFPTMLPTDLKIPMVAPADLGVHAAKRLMSGLDDTGIHYVEGPQRYTTQEVADTLASLLKVQVKVEVTPRDQWETAFREQGFSPEAARAYTRMTEATVDDGFETPEPHRGSTTLKAFFSNLVAMEPTA